MSSFGIYLIGMVVLIGGLAWGAWLAHVPQQWILVGVVVLLIYVGVSFFFNPAPGWTSTALIILTTSAVQLFTLAVIGEYVGRLYIDSKQRPLFIIEEVVREDRSA